MDVSHTYSRKRWKFGKKYQLRNCEAREIFNFGQDEELAKNHLVKIQADSACQASSLQHCALEATDKREFILSGMNHDQGGWPEEVNHTISEQKERYRKRIQREEDFIKRNTILTQRMLQIVRSMNAIQEQEADFSESEHFQISFKCELVKRNVYRHQSDLPQVRSISLNPGPTCQIVVTMEDKISYIWDESEPTEPLMAVTAPSTMTLLEYNSKDRRLGGGLESGLVGTWDIKAGGEPIAVSTAIASHRGRVTGFRWINSKTGREFMTTGEDGWVKWWDCDNLSNPMDEMDIGAPLTALEYDPNVPTKYLVGTSHGLVICGNRKGSTEKEKLPWCMEVGSPVSCLAKNPMFTKVFLTVDWNTVRVWSEVCRDACLFNTHPSQHGISTACWSPTRASLIITGREDGYLEVWDYLESLQAPIVTLRMDQQAITAIRFENEGQKAGAQFMVGAASGSMYVGQLSQDQTMFEQSEKARMNERIDLEVARIRLVDAKAKEMQKKQAMKKIEGMKDAHRSEDGEHGFELENLGKVRAEFLASKRQNSA